MFPRDYELLSSFTPFGGCNDAIPGSTFWIVVAFLFISIMYVFDIAIKLEQQSAAVDRETSSRVSYLRQDINLAYDRITVLEKKVFDLTHPPAPAPAPVKAKEHKEPEPEPEPEPEDDEE